MIFTNIIIEHYMYKLVNNLLPDHIVQKFTLDENSQIHNYDTRHSSDLHVVEIGQLHKNVNLTIS